ncbi:MAG: ATP-dependent DNA helicase [Dermatophilaceae bacterium]
MPSTSPSLAPGLLALDADQARAVAHRGPLLRVLGGPGTGKTSLAVVIVAGRVASGEVGADRCVIIAASRRSAARVRDAVTRRIGATTREPLARTFPSLAFGILRRAAIRDDAPAPRLLTGPEQDAILRELLAGHRADPETAPAWPADQEEALGTDGFRSELRDLLMRAVEYGVDAAGLAELGGLHGRADWVAAARVLDEYDQVTALSRPGAFDPSWLLTGAGDLLEDDPEALAGVVADLDLVVVDDAQELTAGAARLLRILAAQGVEIVLIGDPDAAVQTFRGADPSFLADRWRELGVGPTVVLGTSHRLTPATATAAARVAELIGALGGGRQRAFVTDPGPPGPEPDVHVFRSAAQEAAHLADVVRRAHLIDRLPWREMAVVVRGQGRADVIRRALVAAHVPVADAESGLPVGAQDAVRPLVVLCQAAVERVAHRERCAGEALDLDPDGGWRLRPEVAVDLLTSAYGGADAVTLRRLRRAVRRAALDDGRGAPADVLLAAVLARPGDAQDLAEETSSGMRRLAAMLAAVTSTVAAGGASPEDVLWAAWSAAEIADEWRATALAGGRAGARADRDLDAVIDVLARARDFAVRLPGVQIETFLDQVAGSPLAADSIVARSVDRERVEVLTPHAAAGREWSLVAVAAVQEGAWPDLRLRGSLLGSEVLVDVLCGRETSIRASQTVTRHDEARLFHVALTRSRGAVHLSAVRADDESPSSYLDVVAPWSGPGDRPFTEVEQTMTLVGAVAALRRTVTAAPTSDRAVRERAAGALAHLARVGVRGADPREWWGLREVSDDRPRVDDGALVKVSPSGLVGFGECEARWLLTGVGGQGPAVGSAALGTLVHEVLAQCGDADVATLGARLDDGWARLGLAPGWISRAKRGDAGRMLERAAAYFELAKSQGWRRVAAEQQMSLVLGRARILGVVDRLEADADGRLRILDFKTGSSKPKREEVAKHPQLGAYQEAVERGAFGPGAVSAGAALVQLGKAGGVRITSAVQEQVPLAEADEPGWARDLIEEAATTMAGATYRAIQGTWCRTCPVRTSCPVHAEGAMLA